MLQRYVSASVVVGTLIGFGAVALYAVAHQVDLRNAYLLALLWCALPAAWGLWALLVPKPWLPQRLPQWGAILGLIVGVTGAFILNIPVRVLGIEVHLGWRLIGVVLAMVAYYWLWMVVRMLYRALHNPQRNGRESDVAA